MTAGPFETRIAEGRIPGTKIVSLDGQVRHDELGVPDGAERDVLVSREERALDDDDEP